MSLDPGKLAIVVRSGGQCEMPVLVEERPGRWYPERCPENGHDYSHRLAAGKGGPRTAANGLHLCRFCHDWCHANPEASFDAGWHLESGSDPASSRVWLLDPFPGWWLLDDDPPDRGEHVLRLVAQGAGPVELRRVSPVKWAA